MVNAPKNKMIFGSPFSQKVLGENEGMALSLIAIRTRFCAEFICAATVLKHRRLSCSPDEYYKNMTKTFDPFSKNS